MKAFLKIFIEVPRAICTCIIQIYNVASFDLCSVIIIRSLQGKLTPPICAKLICNLFMQRVHMSTACQRLKSPKSLSGTSAHPTMVTLVNMMVMNGLLPSFLFHVNRLVPFLRWSYFRLWPWKINFKVKVMGVVKGQGHTIGPEAY